LLKNGEFQDGVYHYYALREEYRELFKRVKCGWFRLMRKSRRIHEEKGRKQPVIDRSGWNKSKGG